MVLFLHPALKFLQIQNKDNDDIVLLAPPRPWLRRKCSAAAAVAAICSNGPLLLMNGKGISGEGAASSCTPFITLLMTNCVICRHVSASFPLSAAEALCSGGYHRCSLKYEATPTPGDAEKQTIHCPGWRLSKEEDEKEKSGFSSSSLDSSLYGRRINLP